jgi:hypothetical protein
MGGLPYTYSGVMEKMNEEEGYINKNTCQFNLEIKLFFCFQAIRISIFSNCTCYLFSKIILSEPCLLRKMIEFRVSNRPQT